MASLSTIYVPPVIVLDDDEIQVTGISQKGSGASGITNQANSEGKAQGILLLFKLTSLSVVSLFYLKLK